MSARRPPLHFLVPGFSKCGTTTLRSLLAEHPGLYVPRGEAWFFSRPGKRQWRRYANLFSQAPRGALLGEGSGSYASIRDEEKVRARMIRAYPDIKLIFVARDPFDRIDSSFREFHNSGHRFSVKSPWDLEEALDRIPQLIQDTHYEARIQNFRHHVDPEQILVVFLEDLAADQSAVLRRCFEFLGVDPQAWKPRDRRRLNRGSLKLYDTKQMRELRERVFHPAMYAALEALPLDISDPLLEKLGLRKRFGEGHLHWTASARDRVLDVIEAGTRDFLRIYGKDADFWPRFAAAAQRRARNEPEPVSPRATGLLTPDAPSSPAEETGRTLVIILHEDWSPEWTEADGESPDPLIAALSKLGVIVRIRQPKTQVNAVVTICDQVGRGCLFVSVNPARFEASGLRCPGIAYFTRELDDVAAWRLFANQLGAAVTCSSRSSRAVRQALGDDFPVIHLDPEVPAVVDRKALAKLVDRVLGLPAADSESSAAATNDERKVGLENDSGDRLGGGGRFSV